jgi:hypothetical protein
LIETLRSIGEQTLKDGGQVLRSVHAKTHGILHGEIEVPAALPEYHAQGLFARPARYPVVMRLSTIPGDILNDSVSTPRGLAIKIIGVQGERLEGAEADVTQDLVLVNGPAFGAPNARKLLATLKLLAKTTDRTQALKKVISGALRGVQDVIVATTGTPNVTVATLGGQPETHILGEAFTFAVRQLHRKTSCSLGVAGVGGACASPSERQGEPGWAPRSGRGILPAE